MGHSIVWDPVLPQGRVRWPEARARARPGLRTALKQPQVLAARAPRRAAPLPLTPPAGGDLSVCGWGSLVGAPGARRTPRWRRRQAPPRPRAAARLLQLRPRRQQPPARPRRAHARGAARGRSRSAAGGRGVRPPRTWLQPSRARGCARRAPALAETAFIFVTWPSTGLCVAAICEKGCQRACALCAPGDQPGAQCTRKDYQTQA